MLKYVSNERSYAANYESITNLAELVLLVRWPSPSSRRVVKGYVDVNQVISESNQLVALALLFLNAPVILE